MRLGLPDGAKLWVRCAKWILQNFNALRKFFDYHIFANRLTYPAVSYYCRSQLSLNVSLCSGVKKVLPDLVVFPSSAYDPDGIDLVEICNSLNIETLFLVDNWDNLSSKSILWRKPTYLGVWGQQSVDHAVEIQGFPRKCVFPIGTPRYENYFSLRTQKLTPPFDFPYVLFVGTALAFDEASVLIRLDSLIESTRSLSGLKIVYRPHPWRQGTDSIAGCNLKHVVIDPQVESNYLNRKHSVDFQPSLDYYPGLIKNSLFVLGGLTSMLIEASIFYKKFVALVHDDEANFTSPHNALKYYAHFQKLERVSSIVFCRHLNDLDKIFADTFSSRSQVDRQQIDEQRTYFLYCDEKTYGQRLGELCASLLLSQKNLEHDSSAHCC